jgi:hypothetical protein
LLGGNNCRLAFARQILEVARLEQCLVELAPLIRPHL